MYKILLLCIIAVIALSFGAGYLGCLLYICFTTFPALLILSFILIFLPVSLLLTKASSSRKLFLYTLVVIGPWLAVGLAVVSMSTFANIRDTKFEEENYKKAIREKDETLIVGRITNSSQGKIYENSQYKFRYLIPSGWGYEEINGNELKLTPSDKKVYSTIKMNISAHADYSNGRFTESFPIEQIQNIKNLKVVTDNSDYGVTYRFVQNGILYRLGLQTPPNPKIKEEYSKILINNFDLIN